MAGLLVLGLWLLGLLHSSLAAHGDYHVLIDCGGYHNFSNSVNQTWMADNFFSGGAVANVSIPQNFPRQQERSLRYFPISQGKKNCYDINVPVGRYMIQMFFAYNNYDNMSHSPSFDVSVEGTVVFNWRFPWSDDSDNYGAYSDLYAFIHDGSATICFYSIGTDAPVIGSLELLQVDDAAYNASSTGQNAILVNYGRISAGNSSFGPGYDNVTDFGGRSWEADDTYTNNVKALLTSTRNVVGANVEPNYWPEKLYETCRYEQLPNVPIIYSYLVDAKLDYQIWFHFAEIDPNVTAAGQRVFNVTVNNVVVLAGLDLFQKVGLDTAFDFAYTLRNLTGGSLVISLVPQVGSPLICGIEVIAVLQADIATNVTEATAMHALKTSLNVPERMGWNGDPCAPTEWDAWEGVTCNLAADGSSLVITHMNIADQGLSGVLPPELTYLSHLISLNASSNKISGPFPATFGEGSLVSLDLSFNALEGPIPPSMGSPRMQHLRLNNNRLAGPVPESVYAIGVHGGYVNLADNQGLCGVPSLPDCPYKWKHEGMSPAAKAVLIIGVLLAAAIIVGGAYVYIQRRKAQEDYNFNLPHQLVERTKWYQQHKMTKQADPEGVSMIQSSIPNRFGFSSNIAARE
ncbi:receptor-like protein 4 [Physcomitrium patens]|uniref:Malectin-like domain-containing protein n=1 Tax=Physcomitrium patens TaxID=3218 RepID=A0A2K1K248_PHYPA|nr:receptor like protein 4-like [Physcomitrium patens]PNR47842.1 hypothetical protein PHYPA_012315 [Physcomitrium patens]|eukprot:XP_024385222.1 receptor like protein 4-like [Physcomitrella patens]